jgi:hypothetical protein
MSKQDIEKRLGFAAQGVKDTFAAHPENIAWMRSLPTEVVAKVRQILTKPHSSSRANALRNALKSGGASFNKWVPDANTGAQVLGWEFNEAFSRPGAKAKFATEVGRKGNKSAMISRDATGTYYAYVVQRIETGIGKDEDMLGTMRAYSTEARAKAAALRGLETSGLRGGFARPGVKAEMAAPANWEAKLDAKNLADGFNVEGLRELLGAAKEIARKYPQYKALGQKLVDGINMVVSAVKQMKTESMKAARPGVKAKMDSSDGNYFTINGYVDNSIWASTSFDTQAEAEYSGKRVLEALKKSHPKAKNVNVQILKVVDYSPQKLKTLSLRPGAKAKA